jgi:phosphohistidine phosphatase
LLYLVHHGDAVGPDVDPRRPLSDRGRIQVDTLAKLAADQGAKPEIIWHSGKMRARQTAEAFWRHCNALATFASTHGLQPTDPTTWIEQAIAAETCDVMLVGHFPHLPRLLGVLLARPSQPGSAEFPLHGIVALEREGERENGKWIEKWRLAAE